jgi:4-amino-4-deoxy-L-arabinose transferase-like glycosyltransferase
MKRIDASRRHFLRTAAATSIVGPGAGFALNLATMAAAQAQPAPGYRALVCVFLNGGNDQGNMVLATDPALRRRPWRLLGPGLAAVAAFVAVFLYLPIRHAAGPAVDFARDYFPQVDLYSLRGWLWMIRGGMFESLFFSVSAHELAVDERDRSALRDERVRPTNRRNGAAQICGPAVR